MCSENFYVKVQRFETDSFYGHCLIWKAPVGRGKSFLAYEFFKVFVIVVLAATFVKSPKNKFGWKIETFSRKQLFLTGSQVQNKSGPWKIFPKEIHFWKLHPLLVFGFTKNMKPFMGKL